jgi:hypothetical protein
LNEIARIRTDVSTELRKAQSGGTIDRAKVYSLIERYGYLDGQISAFYAQRFTLVKATLTSDQMSALVNLRNLDVKVDGAYLFSSPAATPTLPDIGFMFGLGTIPNDAGQYSVPNTFDANDIPPQK